MLCHRSARKCIAALAILVIFINLISLGMITLAQPKPTHICALLPAANSDLSWSQSMYDSLASLGKKLGSEVDIEITDGQYKHALAIPTLDKYTGQGCNIIIVHYHVFSELVLEYAAQFPEILFLWGSGTDYGKAQGLKNIIAYQARAEEGAYVNGMIAALMSKTGVVGVIGGKVENESQAYVEGFVAGAKAAKPKIKVNQVYTDSRTDVPLVYETTQKLLKQRADILSGVDPQVVGALSVLRDAKKYWLGTQCNQATEWPEVVIAAQVYDWTSLLERAVTARKAGTAGGSADELTLADGLRIEFNDSIAVPDAVKEAAESAVKQIIAGEVKVPVSTK